MDITQLINDLKTGILGMIKDKFGTESQEVKSEVESHLAQSKDKLERWSRLLEDGALTKDDFLWLVKSQRDVLHLASLHRIGITQLQLGHFKSKVISFISETVFKFIL